MANLGQARTWTDLVYGLGVLVQGGIDRLHVIVDLVERLLHGSLELGQCRGC